MYTSLKTLVLLAYLLWSHFFNNTKFKESYIFVSGCIGVCSHFFNNTKFKECYIFISGCIGLCFTPVIPKEIVYLGYLTLLLDFSLLLMIKMVNASTRVSLFWHCLIFCLKSSRLVFAYLVKCCGMVLKKEGSRINFKSYKVFACTALFGPDFIFLLIRLQSLWIVSCQFNVCRLNN